MIERARGALSSLVILCAVLAIEAFGLKSGTLGLVVVIAVLVIALAAILAGVNLERVAVGTALLGAFTLTWNGIFLGPVRPGDVLVMVAVLIFAMANPNHGLV